MSHCSTSEFAETKARPEDAAEVGDGVQTTFDEGVQMVAKVCVASYFLSHVIIASIARYLGSRLTGRSAPSLRLASSAHLETFWTFQEPRI
jgi:hypothetical protein